MPPASFEILIARAKIGRNPKAPEKDVSIPARIIVKFSPGKKMREGVVLLPEPGKIR